MHYLSIASPGPDQTNKQKKNSKWEQKLNMDFLTKFVYECLWSRKLRKPVYFPKFSKLLGLSLEYQRKIFENRPNKGYRQAPENIDIQN